MIYSQKHQYFDRQLEIYFCRKFWILILNRKDHMLPLKILFIEFTIFHFPSKEFFLILGDMNS